MTAFYYVGERGPELFVPLKPGAVLPSSDDDDAPKD